ncbi:hypothetical protein QYF61_026134 [Mycteria americana]|uniref:Uncharacterized protein n=1 Tax=Mycteria americana TaxID=33587 RepID=A0AAN7RYE4_MYCAM|nr:hypothetical protein QYF61_026134 [Mycteria americana]
MNYLMVAYASECLIRVLASPAALGVQSSTTAAVSDAEMGLTDPGAGEDADHVIKVLRRVSSGFGSGSISESQLLWTSFSAKPGILADINVVMRGVGQASDQENNACNGRDWVLNEQKAVLQERTWGS